MKAIKYVRDSKVYESLIIDNINDNVIYLFMEYMCNGTTMHSYSFNKGRREWTLLPLDFTELTAEEASKFEADLLELNQVVGINDNAVEYYLTALADLRSIIKGNHPFSHRQRGIVIEYQEFNH